KDWAFLDEVWSHSDFQPAVLKTIVRTQDSTFLQILNDVRSGQVTPRVNLYLNERKAASHSDQTFQGTRLFPFRDATEKFNLERLNDLEGETSVFETEYFGEEKFVQDL